MELIEIRKEIEKTLEVEKKRVETSYKGKERKLPLYEEKLQNIVIDNLKNYGNGLSRKLFKIRDLVEKQLEKEKEIVKLVCHNSYQFLLSGEDVQKTIKLHLNNYKSNLLRKLGFEDNGENKVMDLDEGKIKLW